MIDLDLGAFEPRKVLPVGDRLYVTMHQGRGESGTMLMVDGWRDGATAGSESPSFQCDTARNPTEQTVCRTRFLAALDTQLSADYDLALGNITSAAAGGTAADVARFRREQRDWLRQPHDCGADVRCRPARTRWHDGSRSHRLRARYRRPRDVFVQRRFERPREGEHLDEERDPLSRRPLRNVRPKGCGRSSIAREGSRASIRREDRGHLRADPRQTVPATS